MIDDIWNLTKLTLLCSAMLCLAQVCVSDWRPRRGPAFDEGRSVTAQTHIEKMAAYQAFLNKHKEMK